MNESAFRNRMSIRYRFLFVFFILIIVPFLLVGYIALSKSEKTIRSTNLDSVMQTGKNLDSFFRYVLNEQDKLMASDEMQQLFDDPQLQSRSEIAYTEQLQSYVDNVNYSNKLFRIRLLPLDPSQYPTYMRSVYGSVDVGQADWFADIVNNGRSYWKVFGPEDHPGLFVQPVLSSVKRLHSLKSYQPLGVAIMDIRPAILADFIYPVKQFPNQKLVLTNKRNQVIYSTDGKYDGPAMDADLLEALQNPGSSRKLDYNGQSSLVSVSALLGNELRLVSITPTKDLNNPVAVLNKLTLSFLIFYFLLSILLVGYITVNFSNPISSLVRQMKVIARSNFNDASLDDSRLARRRDEIGWLYRGMSGMIGEIRKLLKETKDAEVRKKRLEFQVLTHQINPHFLYNTLDTIRWKAEARDAGEIAEMASSLGKLFRLSLNKGKELTTVQRELELLQSYIHIEKVRQSSAIRVTFMVDEGLRELPFMRLILQPIVENAIRHGIADKQHNGVIIIQGSLEEGRIRFQVIDNGPGIPADRLPTLLDPAHQDGRDREGGLGLINVHERLRLYFGEPFGLEVQSEPGRGTTVILLHPVLPDSATEIEG